MDNTKESIEEQIKSLQDKLQDIFESEKKKRNIRYISSNIEGGEFPIENDTFNIICKTIGNGSIPLYEYEVTNLSHALREAIHDINQNIHRFRLVSKNGPETVRNSYDICFNVGNVNINSSSVLTEENKIKWNRIKNILETKDWQISDDTRTYGGIFKRYFKIKFKNNYKLMPHISFYITPNTDKYMYKIIEITHKYAVIEISVYKNDVHSLESYMHWQVTGILDE